MSSNAAEDFKTVPVEEQQPDRGFAAREVGWFLDDPFISSLASRGVKIRIAQSDALDIGTAGHPGELSNTRIVLSNPGRGIVPGRRVAVVEVSYLQADGMAHPAETLELEVLGPQRNLFHRERLFSGPVASRDELLSTMRALLNDQQLGR